MVQKKEKRFPIFKKWGKKIYDFDRKGIITYPNFIALGFSGFYIVLFRFFALPIFILFNSFQPIFFQGKNRITKEDLFFEPRINMSSSNWDFLRNTAIAGTIIILLSFIISQIINYKKKQISRLSFLTMLIIFGLPALFFLDLAINMR